MPGEKIRGRQRLTSFGREIGAPRTVIERHLEGDEGSAEDQVWKARFPP